MINRLKMFRRANLIERIVMFRMIPGLRTISYYTLKLLSIDLPKSVKMGKNIRFMHWAPGTVIHQYSEIEDGVKIFQNVTLGRSDVYRTLKESKMERILIKEGAILGAGAKILCKEGTLVVGRNTLIGANSVLTTSTGDNEIWAGVPAKKVGDIPR